jgi:hypothetical protein
VLNRIETIEGLEATRIARAIEYTRFPVSASAEEKETEEEGMLRWPRLSEQFFRVDKWSVCRG